MACASNGTDPGLGHLTPLQYKSTNPNGPLVIAAVIGWKPLTAAALALIGLLTGAVLGARRLLRRHTARRP